MKTKTTLPVPVAQSFNNRLLTIKLWISDEDYDAIKKLCGFARFNFTRLPKKYSQTIWCKMENIKKQMPAQGGNVLRMRRYE